MPDVRLVMAAGSSPGAGKTTLVESLAKSLAGDGVIVVTEDEVWGARRFDNGSVDHASTRPEFVELLHSGRLRSAQALEATFDRISDNVDARWWLQDWTWPDLAAMALESPKAADAPGLVGRMRARRAVVLYLKVEAMVAMSRALSERGHTWLRRHALGLGLSPDAGAMDVAAFYERLEDDRLRWLGRSGARTVVLDAGRPTPRVAADALNALVA